VLGLIKDQHERARLSHAPWPVSETIPALTRRVSDLEARIRTLEADLAAERQRSASAAGESMRDALLQMQRSIEEIRQQQAGLADELAAVRASALSAMFASGDPSARIASHHAALDPKQVLLDEIFARLQPRFAIEVAPVEIASARAEVAIAPAAVAPTEAPIPLRQIQVVVSPITSFTSLLDVQRRIRALVTVSELHLHDFRNGVATFAVSVSEAISPAEFGAVIQMFASAELRLIGATHGSVEMRVEGKPQAE
jgi:hypothetical protein